MQTKEENQFVFRSFLRQNTCAPADIRTQSKILMDVLLASQIVFFCGQTSRMLITPTGKTNYCGGAMLKHKKEKKQTLC